MERKNRKEIEELLTREQDKYIGFFLQYAFLQLDVTKYYTRDL